MTKVIDPWSAELLEDYAKIVKNFGLEEFNVNDFPEPNRIMRRGIVFAGRDLNIIAKCIKEKKPYYVLSGIMPSSDKIHFGNKLVIEQIRYFQDHGAIAYVLVADLEAAATRGVTLEEARNRALEFHIPAYIALGLDPKKTIFYFQSENKEVTNLGFMFSQRITANEFKAIYGTIDPGRVVAAVTQCGDMLYPQTVERMPGIIPVGLDQDPHIRLCRDLMKRFKQMKFAPLASIYHKFTPSLDGSLKMSKSKPESCLSLPEDIKGACKKIKSAMSGGRDTLEEHRKKGAIIEQDIPYQLLKMHFIEDDKELQRIHDEYKAGKMTSGEIKQITCDRFEQFMKNFEKELINAKKHVNKLKFVH